MLSQVEEFGPPKRELLEGGAAKKRATRVVTGQPPDVNSVLDRLYALSEARERRYWSSRRADGFHSVRRDDRIGCQGDVDAVNRALAQFATLAVTTQEIRLLPAPGV